MIDVGEGPAVLLVHGFPDSIYLWRHQVPALPDAGYRVIAADNRGMGQSAVPAASEVPTLGLWSTGDAYLVEEQMVAAGRFVQAEWRYEQVEDASHWSMLDRPDHISRLLLNHLDQHHHVS